MLQLSQNDKNLTWLNKSWFVQNEWFFNTYQTIDLCCKKSSGSGWLVSYRNKGECNDDFSARFEVGGFSSVDELQKSLWEGNKVTLNWVHAHKGQSAHGIEVIFNLYLVLKQT